MKPLLLFLLLLMAPRVHGQMRERNVHDDGNRRIVVERVGAVVTSADERHIVGLEPGGFLVIETTEGGRTRRMRATPAPEGVRLQYRENGLNRPLDDGTRAWMARTVEAAVYATGMGAEARVARLMVQGGLPAALAWADRYRSDGARLVHLTALLDLRRGHPGDAARVLRATSILVASDGDRARFLTGALEAVGLADPAVRRAFFASAGALGSDGDWARVLGAALGAACGDGAVVLGVLGAFERDRSDGDEARVLGLISDAALDDRRVRTAYLAAVRHIHSDGDRARVLARPALFR
jgi:hypothetical protein